MHCEIRVSPIPECPQALKFLRLNANPFLRVISAFLPEYDRVNLVFIFALLAVLLFHLPLDW